MLENLPFPAGEAVEIIILERSSLPSDSNPSPLQGKVIYDDELFEPVL